MGEISGDKISLFIFLLIYVLVIGLVTTVFSPAYNQSYSYEDMNVKDPGAITQNPVQSGPNFFSIVIGIFSSIFAIMTLQISFVPAFVQIILAIPCYAFIIVLADMIISLLQALSAFLDAVLPDWL